MSRGGGRGGARGGGGAGRGNGKVKMSGVDLPWDMTGLEVKTAPEELFPPIPPPQAAPATNAQKAAVRHYIALRDRMHDGPYYTQLDDGQGVDGVHIGQKRKADKDEGVQFDPFTGNQTFTARYLKQKRKMPKLDTRPYVMHLFPKELHDILDPLHAKTNGAVNGDEHPAKKRKLLTISRATQMTKLERLEMEEDERRLQAEAAEQDVDDEDEDGNDEEEDKEPDEVDDDLSAESEDSEDADDDYNAERYFETGEGDDVDEGGHDDNFYD